MRSMSSGEICGEFRKKKALKKSEFTLKFFTHLTLPANLPLHPKKKPRQAYTTRQCLDKFMTRAFYFCRFFPTSAVLHLTKRKFIFMEEIDKIMKKVFASFFALHAKVFYGEIIDRERLFEKEEAQFQFPFFSSI